MADIKVTQTGIEGLVVIEPTVFGDNRGYFLETYNESVYKNKGIVDRFVQDNESKSHKGVLRGLHFQSKRPQAKLVRVLQGEVYDVAVDLRQNSKSYGRWYGLVLSGDNHQQFYIPKGFAHGFLVLSEEAVFAYKCSDYYDPDHEGGLRYDDPDIGIDWPIKDELITLSEKDRLLPYFKGFKSPF